jgi:N-acylneuraminate cytidylyltransferase
VSSKADSLVSVYKVEDEHPGRMYKTQDEQLFPLYPNLISLNRQDLPDIFHRNGSIYISKVDIIKNGSIYGDKIQKFEMSKTQSINIDDEIDWKLAEIILNEKNKKI